VWKYGVVGEENARNGLPTQLRRSVREKDEVRAGGQPRPTVGSNAVERYMVEGGSSQEASSLVCLFCRKKWGDEAGKSMPGVKKKLLRGYAS